MTRQQFLQNVNPYCHCEALRPRQSISSESGRSLVEMLGVLAIMGILTIGGIAGFNYAMNKQRANATVGYVNELAVLGTGQMLAGNKPKLLDYPKQTPSGYAADITTDDDKPNAFYIEIDKVPTPVCDEIISRLDGWKMVNDIGFFNGVGACADQEKVGMWFEITANASKGDTDYHCTTNADCKPFFGTNSKCNDKGTCEYACSGKQVKTAAGCCDADKVFNGGCCPGTIEDGKCCRRIWNPGVGPENMCCSEGFFMIKTGECLSCDDPSAPNLVSSAQYTDVCKICPNRTLIGRNCHPSTDPCLDGAVNINNECYCPLDKPVMDDGGHCHPCNVNMNPNPAKGWPALIKPPFGLMHYGNSALSFYCNRKTGGGYSGRTPCESGSIGLPGKHTITLADGSSYQVSNSYGECKSCDEVATSELKYQAWCESCGGTWSGSSWDNGACTF